LPGYPNHNLDLSAGIRLFIEISPHSSTSGFPQILQVQGQATPTAEARAQKLFGIHHQPLHLFVIYAALLDVPSSMVGLTIGGLLLFQPVVHHVLSSQKDGNSHRI
jgi:hypothetical protein